MKNFISLCISIICFISIAISQTYTATLAIDDLDITGLNSGDAVIVPVRMVEKSGGMIAGFQLFIGFDHTYLGWNGTSETPLKGIQNVHTNLKYSPGDWVFNDNGKQFVAIWIDPALTGVELRNGDVIAEFIFNYKGGLQPGEKSLLTWGDTYEVNEGIVEKGPTEITSELFDIFVLKYINGSVFIRK